MFTAILKTFYFTKHERLPVLCHTASDSVILCLETMWPNFPFFFNPMTQNWVIGSKTKVHKNNLEITQKSMGSWWIKKSKLLKISWKILLNLENDMSGNYHRLCMFVIHPLQKLIAHVSIIFLRENSQVSFSISDPLADSRMTAGCQSYSYQ